MPRDYLHVARVLTRGVAATVAVLAGGLALLNAWTAWGPDAGTRPFPESESTAWAALGAPVLAVLAVGAAVVYHRLR